MSRLFSFFSFALVALSASVAVVSFSASTASAHGLSYAMLIPLAGLVAAPDLKADLPRTSVRIDHSAVQTPFGGRKALTRDLEAMAVRDALTPINTVS